LPILREERRLRVFESKVLKGIFGPKGDDVTSEWRKIHNEELNDLYCSPNILHSFVFSLQGRAWQESEPSHVTHCILGKFLGVVGYCFPPPLDFPL